MNTQTASRLRVSCPKCGASVLLDTLRYSHSCKPRGRPPKYIRDGSPYTSAVAAMEQRLLLKNGSAESSPEVARE